MVNLLNKISKHLSRSAVRVKTSFYYHIVRHVDDGLKNMTLRECYEAALSPVNNLRVSISERFYERDYNNML